MSIILLLLVVFVFYVKFNAKGETEQSEQSEEKSQTNVFEDLESKISTKPKQSDILESNLKQKK